MTEMLQTEEGCSVLGFVLFFFVFEYGIFPSPGPLPSVIFC